MKKQLKFLFVPWVMVTFLIMTSGCNDDDDGPTQNVITLAQGNENLSTLETAIAKFPDLVSALSGSGQVTIFAPTNAAFDNLLATIGQSSLDDIPDDVLHDILEYHVLSGTTLSGQLTSGEITTVGGEEISVGVSSGVLLNGTSTVTTADVRAKNGVVHIVDEVLVPPSIRPIVGTIVAPAFFNRNFTTLIAAVKAASPSIFTALLDSGDKTLFAPTNDAFAAAGITTLPDQATLDAVLSYHVIGSEVTSSQIASGSSSVETLNGRIYVSKSSSGVSINGKSKIATADIDTSNGVVHVIDRALLPPSETIAEIATGYSTSSPAQFTQLITALSRTEGAGDDELLSAVSSSASNLTVFAPTDEAFQQLYTDLGVSGVNEIPLNTLIAVLKHHVISGRKFSTDLSSGPVSTLNGDVTVDISADPPSVTGGSGASNVANVQESLLDIHATNGVIHVIDRVLLP
ncbi:MAG TPA: fasciclin domain-containing protein [Chryseosolibacter sp.]